MPRMKRDRRGEHITPRRDGTVNGVDLTRAEALMLPVRYSPDRKRQIVRAVRRGIVARDDLLAAHRMHEDEFAAWEAATPGETR